MPGPLGPQGPTVDPNWAWDVPGWTSQANTGDTIGQNLGSPGVAAELVEPAALSGFITRTMDPDVTTAGGAGTTLALTSGTAYLAAMQVLQPAVTSKVIVVGAGAGTATHSWVVLYNAVTGAQVAISADRTATVYGTTATAINWTAATAIAPGYYWAMLLTVNSVAPTIKSFTLAPEAQLLLTGTSAIGYTVGSSLRFAVGTTGLTALATPPAALTSSMVVAPNGSPGSAYFIGIA